MKRLRQAGLTIALGCATLMGCSSSSPRDQNFGKEAGSDFVTPDATLDRGNATSDGGAGAAGAGGTAGTGGGGGGTDVDAATDGDAAASEVAPDGAPG